MGALSGIRVLDFGRYVAGPYCATLLADFGADVIRIERHGGSEDRTIAPVSERGDGALFLQVNRNKRSITFDPRAPGAEEVIRRLVTASDVVVSNLPTSSLAKMGIDYERLCAIRPDIILANVSSFGPIGPWAERTGFDSVGQAMCGSAYLSGPGDQPYRTQMTWVDHTSALYAAFGVMLALRERGASGRGQQIDGSLLGSAIAVGSTYLVEQAIGKVNRTAIGNRSFVNGPTDMFRTLDGQIVTHVVGQPLFRRWTQLVEEPSWFDDPRFATDELRGSDNGNLLSARMAQWCALRTTAEALAALSEAGIPAGPVLSLQETLDHEQVRAMGIFTPVEVPGVDQPAPLVLPPLRMSETPANIRRPPPGIGEQTDEILAEIGFSAEERHQLRASGVV